LENLIERLEREEFDLVAVGRALLSDSAWSNKIKSGRDRDIVAFEREHMTVLT
jgi:2,4-dienoyl-CoA reductase-like NADH-dependent reductase (Old Yellow Enzyme family)